MAAPIACSVQSLSVLSPLRHAPSGTSGRGPSLAAIVSVRTIFALILSCLVPLWAADAQDPSHYRSISLPGESVSTLPLPSLMDYARYRPCPPGFENEAIALINRARIRSGAVPLRMEARLEWTAREHTLRMAEQGRMTHDRWKELLRISGFRGTAWAQNVAWNQRTPEEVVDDWLDSDRHRANILEDSFRYTGLSCVIGREGEVWWTQVFGALSE